VPPVRIHWVSPIPPQETDIAHYTRRILPALSRQAEVILWTDTPGWDPELEEFATVRLFDPKADVPMDLTPNAMADPEDGSTIDAVFHHIGNSWVFHGGILELASKVPGTIVLHDLAIQEFLRDLIHNDLFDKRRYHEAMARHHGQSGKEAAWHILDHGPTPDMLDKMPMFQIALDHATGALCHTPAGFDMVRDSHLVPTYYADLPFAVGPEIDAARASGGPLRLVQFGHIGPNRRLESVLEALSAVQKDIPFVFDVFGKIWDTDYIQGLIQELGIADRVRLRGFAPEPDLDAALQSAHLVFNLRFPTMGEASGSQVRIWNASAAAVVTDLGWYASLPDDCVIKIPLETEKPALIETLHRLHADRDLSARIGTAGRARFLARHTPEHYTQAIIEIARNSGRDAHECLMVDTAHNFLETCGPQAKQLCAERFITLLD